MDKKSTNFPIMIEIEQILVINDPYTPEREPFDLTMDEIQEYGERFFKSGFEADVYLTNGAGFSFVKTELGWDVQVIEDDNFDIAKLPKRTSSPLTFEEYLDLLLTEANAKIPPSLN